jgi:hypothetical protein
MSIQGDLQSIIEDELVHCERALKNGNIEKALLELDHAVRKLKEKQGRRAREGTACARPDYIGS